MMRIGTLEFKRYLYADINFNTLSKEANLAIHRAYEDIHPTRVKIDAALGVVYSESINVEDYVIWLVDMKDEYRGRLRLLKEYKDIFDKACEALNADESKLLQEYKAGNRLGELRSLRHLMLKLKAEVENVLNAQVETTINEDEAI